MTVSQAYTPVSHTRETKKRLNRADLAFQDSIVPWFGGNRDKAVGPMTVIEHARTSTADKELSIQETASEGGQLRGDPLERVKIPSGNGFANFVAPKVAIETQ